MTMSRWIACALSALPMAVLGATGCGGGAAETPAASSAAGGFGDQAAEGAKLYAAHCADCHGASGEGNAKAPPLVGKNALPLDPQPPSKVRKAQFHTAADVFAFVKANMPGNAPGSLSDEQYTDILAFDLKANGVDLGGKKLDGQTATGIVLHP